MVNLNNVLDSFKETVDFWKVSWKDAFLELLKVEFYSMIFGVLFFSIGLGIVVLLNLSAINNSSAFLKALLNTRELVILISFSLLALVFSEVMSSVSYNIVDGLFNKRKIDLFAQFKANFFPALKWMVFWFFIFAIFVVLPFIILVRIGVSLPEPVFNVLFNMFIAFVSIVFLIINFFLMFGLYELFIARQGLFASLSRSVNLVKNNFIETFVFAVIIKGIEQIVDLIFRLLLVCILFVILMVAGVPLLFVLSSVFLNPQVGILNIIVLVIAIVGFIVFFALFFVVSATLQALIFTPLTYAYWKKIKG